MSNRDLGISTANSRSAYWLSMSACLPWCRQMRLQTSRLGHCAKRASLSLPDKFGKRNAFLNFFSAG